MAKERAPHMPWYGREFYADENVLVMTLEQEAAYLRLLWNCWQEGSIPADAAKLAALCKNIPRKKFERDVWPALRDLFASRDDGRLVHRKVELLRTAKEQRRTAWSEAGKRGNERRWGSNRVGDTDPSISRSEGESGSDHVGISADCRLPNTDCRDTNTCAPDGARGAALERVSPKLEHADEVKAWFDGDFWPAYPRKVARPQALKAARRHGKTAADRAVILECLTGRIPAMQEQFRADGDYRPYPATWLNQTPWLDPVETERPASVPRTKENGGAASAIDAAMRLYGERERE